jgi:hypothetical protein
MATYTIFASNSSGLPHLRIAFILHEDSCHFEAASRFQQTQISDEQSAKPMHSNSLAVLIFVGLHDL